MSTELPKNSQFNGPGMLINLDTGKTYPLKIGDNIIGRKDEDTSYAGEGNYIAIETECMSMSRFHIVINVSEVGATIRLHEKATNDIVIDGRLMKIEENAEVPLEGNQVIRMPFAKLRYYIDKN